jgi:hypothetical protein
MERFVWAFTLRGRIALYMNKYMGLRVVLQLQKPAKLITYRMGKTTYMAKKGESLPNLQTQEVKSASLLVNPILYRYPSILEYHALGAYLSPYKAFLSLHTWDSFPLTSKP